jgi:hypothetical protein
VCEKSVWLFGASRHHVRSWREWPIVVRDMNLGHHP